jgi:ribonuclease HI
MFNKQDTATILTIPLSKGLPEDKQIWTATPHGRFTVNSAYRLILEKELQGEGESSKGNPMGQLWRAIWDVALPNNLKVFMWRALHNALPTLADLEHRKVIQIAWCPWCGLQTETLIHAIWDCVEIKECWDESQITVSHETQFRDFHTLVWEVFDHQGIMGLKEFMAMGWQIWQMRNRKVHEEAKMNPRLVAQMARSIMEVYMDSWPTKEALQQYVQGKWEAPKGGMYKLNYDGALCLSTRTAGMGVVIRNEVGLPMASMTCSRANVMDPFAAELFAAKAGLQLAHDIGIKRVILEGDSANTNKALGSMEDDYSWLGNEVTEARHLLQSLEAWELSTIKRDVNKVAHMLARKALQINKTNVWMEEVPEFAQNQLLLDVSS